MKRIPAGALAALLSFSALAATTVPVQLLTPAGSTAGQAIVSTGPTTAPAWGGVTVGGLAAVAANTVLANATGSSASPTAFSMPSCSAAGNALRWTSGTGFVCSTGNAMTNQPLSQFAATTSAQLLGVISDETGSGSLVFGTSPTIGTATINTPTISGGTINNATVGATTPNTGAFTTLNASGNDALLYQNSSAQSIPAASATTITNWTKVSDRVNANFNATTGVFTAPATGYYAVSASLSYAAAVGVVGTSVQAIVVANSVPIATGTTVIHSTSNVTNQAQVNAIASLTAGQTIVIQGLQNSGSSRPLSGGSFTTLSINRIP